MTTPSLPKDEEATSNERFIFEQVKDRYDAEHERTQNLTAKAGNLVGWVGLIISIVLAGGGVLFTTGDANRITLTPSDIYLLIAILVALVGSLSVGLFAVRPTRFEVVPDPRRLIEEYGQSSQRDTLKTLAVEYTLATEHNVRGNRRKVHQVTASWILFITGMAMTAIFIIVQFNKILGNG